MKPSVTDQIDEIAFFKYKPSDHASARELPYVRDLLAMLDWQIAIYAENAADAALNGNHHHATVCAGERSFALWLRDRMTPHVETPKETPEEVYIDPSRR